MNYLNFSMLLAHNKVTKYLNISHYIRLVIQHSNSNKSINYKLIIINLFLIDFED